MLAQHIGHLFAGLSTTDSSQPTFTPVASVLGFVHFGDLAHILILKALFHPREVLFP